MKFSKTSTLNLSRQTRLMSRERTVHEILSEFQRAYSVFVPASDDFFNLFQLILLHPDRPRSPRNTTTNLRQIFATHPDVDETKYDSKLAEAFLKQFENEQYREISRPEVVVSVSEESLRGAGLTISTPVPRVGISASKSRMTQRQMRLLQVSSNAYTGGTALKRLIWDHAELVFLLILQELEMDVGAEAGDRSLLGVVTRRLISNVGVSRADGKGRSVMFSVENGVDAQIGAGASRGLREVYDDMFGVSGLHFIVFPVECKGRRQWRVYKGIDVCDSELDETANPDALRRDNFYQAGRWFRGTGNLNHAAVGDYTMVTNNDSAGSSMHMRRVGASHRKRQECLGHVDITNVPRTVPFVDIDTRPFLSDFARKQCKLAAAFRKAVGKDPSNAINAVRLLRSALRKGHFESTIRALYDLSGCYRHGIGVTESSGMSELLRYYASGMRRKFQTRYVWLAHLRIEFRFLRYETPEQRMVVMFLLSRRSLVSLGCHYAELSICSPEFSTEETEEMIQNPNEEEEENMLNVEIDVSTSELMWMVRREVMEDIKEKMEWLRIAMEQTLEEMWLIEKELEQIQRMRIETEGKRSPKKRKLDGEPKGETETRKRIRSNTC